MKLFGGKGKIVVATSLKLALAGGLLYWLFVSGAIRLEYLTVSSNGLFYLACGALLAFIAIQLGALRYSILLSGVGIHVGVCSVLRINAVMYFFIQCVVGTASGDAARFYYTVRETGNGSRVGSAIVMDRLIGAFSLTLLSTVGIILNWDLVQHSELIRSIIIPLSGLFLFIWLTLLLGFISLTSGRRNTVISAGFICIVLFLYSFWGSPDHLVRRLLPVLGGACILALFPALFFPVFKPDSFYAKHIQQLGSLGEKGIEFISGILLYADKRKHVFAAVLVTAAQHLLLMLSLFYFSSSLNIPDIPSFSAIFFAAPLSYMAGLVPAPAGGLGVNEAAFELFLKLATSGTVAGGASIYLMQRVWITLFSLSGLGILIFKTKVLPGE